MAKNIKAYFIILLVSFFNMTVSASPDECWNFYPKCRHYPNCDTCCTKYFDRFTPDELSCVEKCAYNKGKCIVSEENKAETPLKNVGE